VKSGNRRVAARAASRLAAYVNEETRLLQTIGASLGPAVHANAEQSERILKNYRITFTELRELDFVGMGPDCQEIATSRIDGKTRQRCDAPGARKALGGEVYRSEVRLSGDFAPVMDVALPIQIAGRQVGVVLAQINLVGIWPAVKEVHVGKSGYARLVTSEGTLIAHGDPQERRNVFKREKDRFAERVKADDPDGEVYQNAQGERVIAVAAQDDVLGWKVIVEQPVAEATVGSRRMRRDLLIIMACALLGAMALGLLFGRAPVRALQGMKRHADQVASGNLDARVALPKLQELRSLADALNRMAGELKRLQEEIRAKERLSTFARVAAGLAHDLQMPIESIRSACDVAIAHPEDQDARDLLKSAAEMQLPRLHRYVRDLRRLAHDGKIPLDFQAIDPRHVADQVVHDAANSPKWQGIDFVAEGDASRVWADESLLVRAVSNLVGNAADACVQRTPPEGRVCVRVYDTDDQAGLVLEVSDTGVGIAADKLEDLMRHDFKSTKRNSGVGLGLGVARHIAAAHGGVVTAESQAGVGSTFRLTIPRQAMAGISAANAKSSQELGRISR
jgi:signal transduction histidine kinase